MLFIHCNKCNQLLGSSYLFRFLENTGGLVELVSKSDDEAIMTILSKLVQSNSDINDYNCKQCLSPICQYRNILFFKARSNVYFRELVYGKETRNVYDIDTDYKFFPLIEYNTSIYLENSEDNEYHYGNEMNVLPSLSDITQFDISPLLRDTPSDDQIEVYIACLTENTICYMPGESNLVVAMIFSYLKKLNPNKKCLYLSNKMPIIYELTSYLKAQTGLSIFYSNSRNSLKNNVSKFDMADVCMFKIDDFLKEIRYRSYVFMPDFVCVIIEESALFSQSTAELCNSFDKMNAQSKPRVISFISAFIDANQMNHLTDMIDGQVYRPIISGSSSPSEIVFKEVNSQINTKLLDLLQNFIQPLINYLHINYSIDLKNQPEIFGKFIKNNILKEQSIHQSHKRFCVANLVLEIVDTVEIINLIGAWKACDHLKSYLNKQIAKNNRDCIWNKKEITRMSRLINALKWSGNSSKYDALLQLILNSPQKKTIICVQNKSTANALFNTLNLDQNIQHLCPHFMTYLKNKVITELFESGRCRLLVICFRVERSLNADQVILFDEMWKDPLVPLDSKCLQIIISSYGQQEAFKTINQRKKQTTQMIDSHIRNRIDLHSIEKVKRLIDHQDDPDSRQVIVKFQIECYVTDSELAKLNKKIKSLEKYHVRIDSLHESYASELELFPDLKSFTIAIKTQCRLVSTEDEILFKFDTVRDLVHGLNNCSSHLFTKTTNSESLDLNSMSMEIGNLVTPFIFVTNESNMFDWNQVVKTKIDSIEKIIQIITGKFKFEIAFNAIDHIICCDDRIDCLFVYIPMKRYPFIYKEMEQNIFTEFFNDLLDDLLVQRNRVCPQSNQKCWTFKLKFGANDRLQVLKSFQHIQGTKLFFCTVSNAKSNYTLDNLRADFNRNSLKLKYCLEVFISQNDYLLDGKINKEFTQKLNKIDPHHLTRVLEKLTLRLQKSFRFYGSLNTLLDRVIEEETINQPINLCDDDSRMMLVRRATVTPLRIIYHFPEVFSSNRVIRRFEPELFIRLRFRDEDMRKLNMGASYSKMTNIYDRVSSLLKNGLDLCSTKYLFLAMSSSQLREHGCWMCDQKEVDKVTTWMGNFSDIKCIGKYAARLGQSLSSSIETFQTKSFVQVPDIMTADNKYCFTDGVGKISLSKAKEICDKYFDTKKYASTFQIRFAGFKGVLSAWPDLKSDQIQFRPSMNKFSSGHTRLDVLNVAEYIPCFLNRQVILILSALGIRDSVFRNLQKTMLRRMSGMLVDKEIAAGFIQCFFRNVFSFATNSKQFDYSIEPFFRGLLKATHRKHLEGLKDKSRIFVEKGRILMGCIDETGTLEENEVFVKCDKIVIENEFTFQYEPLKDENKYEILECQIAVAKNPCMHPGDIRVLQAVDNPKLRHLVNCIVFPSKGKRPITSMCSGSDLDGDLYWITWDKNLIPKEMQEPMEYNAPPATIKEEPIVIGDIIDFFVKFIEIDQLGRLANAHQAYADKESVLSPICKEIALAFSFAVDFPKTGFVAELPDEMKNNSIKEYPDFMQKTNARSYVSDKIIGVMYRECKNIYNSKHNVQETKIELNQSFFIDGYEAYLKEAEQLYAQYRNELERVMTYFGCDKENELFVGVCVSGSQNDEAKDQKKVSSHSIRKIWKYYREIFFESFENLNDLPPSAFQKASAWYVACYSANEANKKLRIISFPWIVEDVMQRFPNIKNNDSFSSSIIQQYLNSNGKKKTFTTFIEIIKLKEKVSQLVSHNLIIGGTVGLFVFEEGSDFHFILDKNIHGNQDVYLTEMASALENEFKNISVDYENKEVKCQLDEGYSFKISLQPGYLSQFIFLRQVVFENNLMLPLYYSILHFAKQDSKFILTNFKFELLLEYFVEYCIQKKYIREPAKALADDLNAEPDKLNIWYKVYDSLNYALKEPELTGQILNNFYRDNAFKSEEIVLESKFNLADNLNDSFKAHFFSVFNLISKAIDIASIWDFSEIVVELNPNRHSLNYIEICCKSPCLYAKDAFLLLFIHLNSMNDSIKFNLYSGNKFIKHAKKECYLPKLANEQINQTISSNRLNSSVQCCSQFFTHASLQFQKAREYSLSKPGNFFKFQLKFGNFYLTSIAPTLVSTDKTVTLSKLIKEFSFNTYDFGPKPKYGLSISDRMKSPLLSNLGIEQGYSKKKPLQQNYCAFNSNINNNMDFLHSILNDNGFDLIVGSSYLVYLCIKDTNTRKSKSYKLKYNSDFELVKIEKYPIIWLNICVRNETKDTSFGLKSSQKENGPELATFKNCPINKDLVVDENFRNSSLTLRQLTTIKYKGDFECWQSMLNLTSEIKNSDLIKCLEIVISNEKYYMDCNVAGEFQIKNEKNTFKINANIDFSTLNSSECNEIIQIMWKISEKLKTIIV